MNTLFIGGSRHVSRLPTDVKKRLDNVISSGHRVIVGDANGADKAVQALPRCCVRQSHGFLLGRSIPKQSRPVGDA